MISDKEQDKLLKAAFERRASSVPPLPEDFAERVLKAVERRRPDGRRTVALWASGIAAALVIAFLLWPREQTMQPETVATPAVAELPGQATDTPLKPKEPDPQNRLSNQRIQNTRIIQKKPGKSAVLDEPRGEPVLPSSSGERAEEVPVIPPDKQPLVDIYLAEEALQVEYMLREPLEELRAFYASFDEEEPDTTVHIIAI